MIIVMKNEVSEVETNKIKAKMRKLGCETSEVKGNNYHILGLIGDTSKIDPGLIRANRNVDKVIFVQEPYKKANRMFKVEDTVVDVRGIKFGGGFFSVIAGPCSVESEDQIIGIAKSVKKSGAGLLRGGAFKPRTSPYSFQGMGMEGLELLKKARKETGLPIVTELMSPHMIETFEENVDVIQIGARNMQNFDLLKEVGKTKKPILLKRGMSATIEELLMAAEYIMSSGNENIILCERGIRTFEKYTRNTIDLSAIPVIKKKSHLPVIVDPSHAAGLWWTVEPLAKAALAVGADGIMVEVHNDPINAKCDGQQSITPERFSEMMEKLVKIAEIEGKIINF